MVRHSSRFLVVLFAFCSVLHYAELIGFVGAVEPSFHFGLTRHALDRILFLPITYASSVFRLKGSLTSLTALAIMLPRAILISPVPRDALLETGGILSTGILASWGIWTQAQERDKTKAALAEMRSVHEILQHYVQSARRNEKRQTVLNTVSTLLSESLELEKTLEKAIHIENARLYERERLVAQRLAISERNYRQLFENASDAIWVHDLEGNITAANEAAEKLVGYSTEELKRGSLADLLRAGKLGLAGMEERVRLLNGTMRIESKPGKGTRVMIEASI